MDENEVEKLTHQFDKINNKFSNHLSDHIHLTLIEERENSNGVARHDYTGTPLGKICSKASKNYFLLLTIIVIILIYYFYLHMNIIVILSKSHSGLNYRFWDYKNLSDKTYLKGFIYFSIFHIFFILFIYTFYKATFTSPGYLSEEYIQIFSLKNKLNGTDCELEYNVSNDYNEIVLNNSEAEILFESSGDLKENSREARLSNI